MEEFKESSREIDQWLQEELATVRTGRASPALLDSVRVDSYGTIVPLNQVGSIAIEDARTIRIAPWDKNQMKAIEKAIVDKDLGLSVVVSDTGVRVSVPEMTGEQREKYVKVAKDKLEEARVRVKKAREDTLKGFEQAKRDGSFTEDDLFRSKEELQTLVEAANQTLEERFNRKSAEIRGE